VLPGEPAGATPSLTPESSATTGPAATRRATTEDATDEQVKAMRATARSPAPGKIEVVAVFGPTASGKTAVAELVADMLGTEVVSADAMQVYRGLPILTNQPERPTRLVGIRSLDEEMSLGAFATLAHAQIDELVARHETAVVAGGTGLYLRAALADLEVPPRAAPEIRERVASEVDRDRAAAHGRLATLDPAAAAMVHPNDRQRLVRALELAETGHSLAEGRDRLWDAGVRRPAVIAGLEIAPHVLAARIRARTEEMFARGVVQEVEAALAGEVSTTAAKTLGLREIAELAPEDALERIVTRTRRYSAYQRKWMRRIPGILLVDADREPAELASEIVAHVRR
jgi:tRNA dimethylallyltransferase